MSLPFTSDEFFDVLAAYNRSFWPIALALWAYALATAVVLARHHGRTRFAAAMLAVQWVWAGVAYHAVFFTAINPAAWLFAALFLVEGALLAWFGVVHEQLRFSSTGSLRHVAAWTLIISALLYPVLAASRGPRVSSHTDLRCSLPDDTTDDRVAPGCGCAVAEKRRVDSDWMGPRRWFCGCGVRRANRFHALARRHRTRGFDVRVLASSCSGLKRQ